MKVVDGDMTSQGHRGWVLGPGAEPCGTVGDDAVASDVQEVGDKPPPTQTPALLLILSCDIPDVTFPSLRHRHVFICDMEAKSSGTLPSVENSPPGRST